MGYFSNLAIEILDQNARGSSPEAIAETLGLSVQEVTEVIGSDYDEDPRAYAERAADLDAMAYGQNG